MRKSIVSQRAILLDERFIELQAAQVSSANSGVCCRQTDCKREDANSNFRRCKPDRSRQAIGTLYFNLWITVGEQKRGPGQMISAIFDGHMICCADQIRNR